MDLRFLGVAISSVHRLSEQVWVNSFRLWFPLGNLPSLRLRARCFYLLVVFPCPLWCSASQCLLPLISSLRAYPRPQDNLPPHPQILSRFSLCVRVIFGFFVAFACGQKNLYKANKGDEIYWMQVTPTLLKAIRQCIHLYLFNIQRILIITYWSRRKVAASYLKEQTQRLPQLFAIFAAFGDHTNCAEQRDK